ncbi:uncharacterized protein [Periplaneta americana]|uniref:uncharacterized protein isoform X2 n=1 Tax=Periplaneta americana TaxID=6978 RepID=UPI0037E725F7
MDVIKTEPEFVSLGVRPCDDADLEEGNPSSAEENLPVPHISQIKLESQDPSCPLTAEVKIEETPVPFTFPVVKCESEEDTFGFVAAKEENKLEVTTEEYENLTDRWILKVTLCIKWSNTKMVTLICVQ